MKILLNNEEFCIDTGAEVIAISERTHHLIDSLELQPLHWELKSPNDQCLHL